jgi:hypothetical protein
VSVGDGYGIENDQGERVFKVDGKASGPRKLDDRSSKRSSFASEPPRARPSRLSDDAPRNAGRPARGERKMGPALAIGGDA